MSQTKFTPGPWATKSARIPVDGEFDWCVSTSIDGADYVIAEAFGRVAEQIRPNAEANARLMAAAPELYEALEELLQDIQQYEAWQRPARAVDVARAAIAKARGEAL